MTNADLLYSDVETDLRASVRDLLTDRCTPESLLARVESDEPYDLGLWRTLARDLGTAGLAVPEELGGQGASAREVALVLEELGRSVAPVPFLGSAVLATSALLGCDTASAEVAGLLRRLAGGEAVGALAVPLSTMTDTGFPGDVTATADGTLDGTVTSVADGTVADVFVVPATSPDGPGLYAVDAATADVAAPVSFDLTRRIADVSLRGATATRLAGPDRAPDAVAGALTTGAGLLASEQLGLAQWCLDETVEYLKGRYQFGRPVGSFQALKHRLADLWLELVGARAAARYAADTLARGDADAPVAVALARSYCAETAVHAAEECIQLHGGIGMTWEHPAHLYLKRAKASQVAFGAPGRHRAALGELVNLPA
ncbi:alkylation response protein AidB-like acyl-CoA dehydrogenase [Prauserella isguenensis]|uniref:Alkylation response protein AidB-like acyl-CoA dehydrogenase n=1 Tax=Prauserella isguenensis TaxID=1470180 RepID=A0A839RZT7_9PSEU|nr:acyl-CoA dehydrogenase family protein [Prauserella isguenensis]MBB3050795.1 alkylation response protein AidB-like acyl-CoA dehydrogenase [Prauserella isguenensis]